MGKGCDPKNLAAVTVGSMQAKGRDIFTEAERYKQLNSEQTAYYERFMANNYGIKPKTKPGESAWDLRVTKNSKKPNWVDDRFYIHPSKQFSEQFYGSIDRKLEKFQRGKDKSRAVYDETIGKPVKQVLKTVNDIVKNSPSTRKMNVELKKLGLHASTVYDARDYLRWLADGGHLKSSGEAQPLVKTAGNISKAQANMNLKWTLGNGVDMMRVSSEYLTKKNGLSNTIKGLHEAMKETNGNPFRRIPALEKQGVYGSHFIDRGGANLNPFEWSITAQKNIVWHLDKAAGGNGHDGIRDTLFDSKPWDRARYDRYKGAALVNGLARFTINETRWLYHTSKSALSGDKRAGANLGLYYLQRAAFTGSASLIPTFVWGALPKDMRESVLHWQDQTGQNLVKLGSRAAFKSAGIDAEIDFTQYLQPTVPLLGSRAQSLGQTLETGGKSGVSAVNDLAHGNIPAAGINAAAGASALANLGLSSVKYLQWLKVIEDSHANSTTLTKILSVTGKELEGEFNMKHYGTEVARATFGNTVKKAK